MPRLPPNIPRKPIYTLLHTGNLTPKQKQITYRLLYGVTATSEYKAKQDRHVYKCTMCRRTQETEEHIFFYCQPKLREALTSALGFNNNATVSSIEMNLLTGQCF